MTSQIPAAKRIPVMEGLLTGLDADGRLKGNRCQKCGTHYFPVSFRCQNPRCQGTAMEEVAFSKRGKLWSFAVNYYPLPPPFKTPRDGFKPFGVGQVQLAEGIRVAGIIDDPDPEKNLEIGMDIEIVLDKMFDDDQGNEIIGWKLKPVK